MFKEYCESKIPLIEAELSTLLKTDHNIAPKLYDAMQYSLLAGGKRLRPILLMAAAEAVSGEDGKPYIKPACALEMIHTYSLIHDDLPAMDDDDYRRGNLTNHKVFGEGIAILAGDALLTNAFEVVLRQENVPAERLLKVVKEFSEAAGYNGMVGGQVIDLLSENKKVDIETLRLMHQAKTGALFRAAIRSGAILAGANKEEMTALTEYAENFGLAFQITDDILDVIGEAAKIGKPVGSDIKNNKSTYVTLYSLEKAKEMANDAVASALDALKIFGREAEFLRHVVRYLITRDH